MTGSLNRSLLVTRPLKDSMSFSKELQKLNKSLNIVCGPLFEIKILPIKKSLFKTDAIIVTSSNAVKSLEKSNIGFTGPMYCIGSATAEVAKKAGFLAVSADGNSFDLQKLIRSIIHTNNQRLLYLRGQEIFSDLAGDLRKQNYFVDEIVCYKKEKQTLERKIIERIAEKQIFGATFFSKQTVNLFFDQVITVPKEFVAFCMSEEVAREFRLCATRTNVETRVPKAPNLKAMCKLIIAAPEFIA